jgi:hypothetical protein
MQLKIKNMIKGSIEKIREINCRYATPRIKLSRGVKIGLLLLRIYLIVLVFILAFKFFTILVG